MNNYFWLSAHLYNYDITKNDVIYSFIPSFLSHLRKQIVIKKYFYVRYLDNLGAHTRLRIMIKETNQTFLKSFLIDKYKEFVSKYPSPTHNSYDATELIRFIDYEPEFKRYGGYNAISVAEDFFYLSTKTILRISKKIDLNDYSTVIAIALKLHLIFLLSLGTSKEKINSILLTIINHWLPSVLSKLKFDKTSIYSEEALKEICFENFKKKYEDNRSSIISVLSDSYDLFYFDKKKRILKQWTKHNTILFKRLNNLKNKNQRNIDRNNEIVHDPFHIILSFIHMTNNRIGIGNTDESYLAYMVLRFLNETELH